MPLDSLLLTKLTPPLLRPGLLPRLALLQRLDDLLAPGARLGLVCASAGYGKTTLVCTWLAAHPELPAAWLSLDENDSSPTRFWSYTIAALQRVQPAIGSVAQHLLASPGTPLQAALVSLLNELSDLPGQLVLALDDYHLVETPPAIPGSPSLGDDLSFFLDRLPSSARVVILSRQEPLLPLARWRGRGQVVELRTADLRFNPAETAAFMAESSGLALSSEQAAAAEAQAEGWPAGLRLLAAAARSSGDLDRLLRDLSASQRFILDYLFSEVLSQQPAHLQAFLLHSSILERLCPPLCAAVLGEPESASRETLALLDRLNLFLQPLDDPPAWYRYHHLFGALLRQRLGMLEEESIPTLHARAAAWLEAHGYLDQALAHWLEAGETSQAGRLVQEHALTFLNRGELPRLGDWMGRLPAGEIDSRPWLGVFQAWLLLLTGQIPGIAPLLQAAERRQPLPGDAAGHIAAIRAYLSAITGDLSAVYPQAELALELLGEGSLGTRAVVCFVLGGAAMLGGDFPAASRAFRQAGEQGLAGGNRHVAIPALNSWIGLLIWQGQLNAAMQEAQRTLRLASAVDGRPLPYAGGVLISLARIALEWNELEAAHAYARQAVAQGELWGQVEGLVHARLVLAEVLSAQGELEGAGRILEETLALQPRYAALPLLAGEVEARRAVLACQGGRMAEGQRWAESLDLGAHSLIRHAEWLAQAGVWLAAGSPAAARDILEPLPALARQAGLQGIVIEALALKACAAQAAGDTDTALDALREALPLAEPEGYRYSFLQFGTAMAPLIAKARHAGIAPAYCSRLLAAFPAAGPPVPASAGALLEPLSGRELQVLALAAQGYSNQEIAHRLYVAESTVKSHLNAILRKLDAANRTEAAAKARALGLIG